YVISKIGLHYKIFWQFDPHWITSVGNVDFHTFTYTLHILLRNHVNFCESMLCVSSQGIWNYSLFRFPQISRCSGNSDIDKFHNTMLKIIMKFWSGLNIMGLKMWNICSRMGLELLG